MNTGLHDVWNLVWKLDLAVRGHSNEQLLDSYTTERRPVIKRVIDMTHFMTNALGAPSKLAQAVRDGVIPLVSRMAPFRHGMVQRLSQLGVAYGGSPIVEGAGKRFFDDSLRGGKGIGSRFLVMIGGDIEASTAEAANELCRSFSDIVELRRTRKNRITLVRPDGYIAYDAPGDRGKPASLRSTLQSQVSGRGAP